MERMNGEEVTYMQLIYDIPKWDGAFPNPSNHLRWFAYRVNLSCWTMPVARFPHELLARFDKYNEECENPRYRVHYEIFPYHNMAEEDIKESAKTALEKEAANIHGQLILSLDRATKAFDKAMEESEVLGHVSQKDRERNTIKKEKRMSLALKRAKVALDAAMQAAETFDQTMDVQELLKGLSETIKAQEEAYKASVQYSRDTAFGLFV